MIPHRLRVYYTRTGWLRMIWGWSHLDRSLFTSGEPQSSCMGTARASGGHSWRSDLHPIERDYTRTQCWVWFRVRMKLGWDPSQLAVNPFIARKLKLHGFLTRTQWQLTECFTCEQNT
jgi:hypothetical protein